jgi:prefoldin subunit 5
MKLKTKEAIEFLEKKKEDLDWYIFNAKTKQ